MSSDHQTETPEPSDQLRLSASPAPESLAKRRAGDGLASEILFEALGKLLGRSKSLLGRFLQALQADLLQLGGHLRRDLAGRLGLALENQHDGLHHASRPETAVGR